MRPPRSLLTTRVARASPSMSSARITRGRLDWTMVSRIGSQGWSDESFDSWIRISGFSSSQIIFSALVTKYGDR